MPLDELLGELGPGIAQPLGGAATDRPVRGTEFAELGAPGADPTDLLLLVAAPDRLPLARIEELARDGAGRGAAALAVKCADADVPALAAVAARTPLAIVRVADEVSWRLFDSLLSQALGERRFRADAHRDRGAEPLFALADELAGYFGGSVAIEDLGRRIIAYSSVPGQLIDRLRTQGILTREVPDSPFNDDQYRTVLRSETPIKYPRMGDEEPRVACAVRAGALPLGTIWAIDASGEGSLTAGQEARIREAASVAASHLLGDLRTRAQAQLPREARLRSLLEGTDVTGSELAELGHAEERGSELIAFEPDRAAPRAALGQLRSTVQRHLALHRPESVTVERDGRVYALVAHHPALTAAELLEPFLPVLDRLVGPGTRAALPGIAHRAGDVAGLRALAERLLDAAARTPHGAGRRIVTVDAVRPLLVLDRAAAAFAEQPELRSPALERLADQPLLSATLLAWCARFGNIARTARDLGAHENTVRYRIRQIAERTGADLEHPDELLTLWLELRARAATESRESA